MKAKVDLIVVNNDDNKKLIPKKLHGVHYVTYFFCNSSIIIIKQSI